MMKVLLINISLRPNSEKVIFPVGIGYIATAIHNAGYDLKILDLDAHRLSDVEIDEYFRTTDFDVAAMGCIVTGYRYVKKYSRMIKRYKDVPIIVGNSVASSIPYILMNCTQADVGVLGEGDNTIVELLNAIEKNISLETVDGIFFRKDGDVVFTRNRELIKNLDNLPFVNYDLFDIDTYLDKGRYNISEPYPLPFDDLVYMPVNMARGCIFSCNFCYHVFRGQKYRYRSADNIAEEIKMLKQKYHVNYIHFADELSIFSKERANDLADCFIENNLDVYWCGDCRAGLFTMDDYNLVLKLKEAGCVSLGFSLESGNNNLLDAMNKHMDVASWISQVKVLQRAGVGITTSLVIGYPDETLETIQNTFDVCYDCDIYPSSGYLLPQPMTPVYDYAIRNRIICDEEKYLLSIGDRQDFSVNFTFLSQRDVEDLVVKNLSRINKKIGLNLDDSQLVKTGHYRAKKSRG